MLLRPVIYLCRLSRYALTLTSQNNPDSKVHRANMGPIWGRQEPGGTHVGPMNFAIWEFTRLRILEVQHIGAIAWTQHTLPCHRQALKDDMGTMFPKLHLVCGNHMILKTGHLELFPCLADSSLVLVCDGYAVPWSCHLSWVPTKK